MVVNRNRNISYIGRAFKRLEAIGGKRARALKLRLS